MIKTQVTIVGNVVADPEMRPTRKGEPFASFRIAVNGRKKDPDTGVWLDREASFYSVAAFNALGINVLNCIRKGEPVVVSGDLRVREYTGQHGESQRSIEITAEHVGHDLRAGRASFARVSRPTLDGIDDDVTAAEGGRGWSAAAWSGSTPPSSTEDPMTAPMSGADTAQEEERTSYDEERDYVDVTPKAS
ncbi:single-stranded DNA-binding protein [Luteipulveratus mongoliensis]|uniref:single-stranded DNA-binding protein n=1 Tax=Luteipulveratus mongoliensis TaxID=571913 RepID=UPI000696454B|nr:single-stranded DNA-binding protein [Luteipulveratus mongoliensis]